MLTLVSGSLMVFIAVAGAVVALQGLIVVFGRLANFDLVSTASMSQYASIVAGAIGILVSFVAGLKR